MRISDWSSDVCSSDLRTKEIVGIFFVGAFVRRAIFVILRSVAGAILIGLAFVGGRLGIVGHLGRLVLGPNETAFNMKRPVHIDPDRQSVVEGKSGSVRVDLGGRGVFKKKKKKK